MKIRRVEVEWQDKNGAVKAEWVLTKERTVWDVIREAKRAISDREGKDTLLRVRAGKDMIRDV